MKFSFFTLLFIVFLQFSVACSSDVVDDVSKLEDIISSSESILIPNKETKDVIVPLVFKKLNDVDYLLVQSSANTNYVEKIPRENLSLTYFFKYSIQKTDSQFFRLIFTLFFKDGSRSKDFSLTVDNRWGFFIRNVNRVARISGKSLFGEKFPNPNNTDLKWNVGGTDLGIIWEMESGQYGIFFGDTYGRDFQPNISNPGPNGSNWRSNVLAFSCDDELGNGITINSMITDENGDAKEIIGSKKDVSGNGDWTSIPTAAIRANGIDYVHYFNIRNWTGWITNYSGLYKSVDNGKKWQKCEGIYWGADSYFGQVGYFKKDGYVYMIGTKTGRDGSARLSRFKESEIENISKYEYWNSVDNQWVIGNENAASVLFNDKVGELSFIYNYTLKKWIIAYFNADRYNITMRIADNIVGPWSEPFELANGREYAQLYGSFFHPLSVFGTTLYFTMSMWYPYNVFLMKANIADMGIY